MNAIRLLSVAVLAVTVNAARTQEDFPKPGAEHERLKQMVGSWDAHIKCTIEPGKAPMESKGVYEAKMDLGGFFLVTEMKGELAGTPFQGRGITGYDSFKKKHVGVWVDSMSPAIYTSEGSFDASGKVLTELMQGPDPKGNPMKMRLVTTVKGPDQMLFQMFIAGADGKEAPMMESVYTRRK